MSERLTVAICVPKLANTLNDFRNKVASASHGKDPYLERVAEYHHHSKILVTDAMAFLHQAGLYPQLDTINLRAFGKQFVQDNTLIDAYVGLAVDPDDGDVPTLRFLLPGGDELPIKFEVSRLLYQLDRNAYVEALNAARGAQALFVIPVEDQGEP